MTENERAEINVLWAIYEHQVRQRNVARIQTRDTLELKLRVTGAAEYARKLAET